MEVRFAHVLRLVRSVLPEALIDREGWERLDARAGGLPVDAADASFGFEVRLDDAEASADLLLSVPSGGRFADALVRSGVVGERGDSAAASLARFLTRWQRPGSPVAAAVDFVALEYDIVGATDSAAPGFFLRSAAESGYDDPGLLSRALALAAGWDESPFEKRGIARVLSALPPGAALRWAGAFPGRGRRAVRLVARAVDGPGEFLQRIGWRGDASVVGEIASEFGAAGVHNLMLALDIADGSVAPGVGVELSQPGRHNACWNEALALMVRRRWCLPGRAAAFGAANRSERIYSRAGVAELICRMHHVKLTVGRRDRDGRVRGGRVGAAKGYVVCVLRPFS